MNVTPRSIASLTTARAASSSVVRPKLRVPRPTIEMVSPLRPSWRYRTAGSFRGELCLRLGRGVDHDVDEGRPIDGEGRFERGSQLVRVLDAPPVDTERLGDAIEPQRWIAEIGPDERPTERGVTSV